MDHIDAEILAPMTLNNTESQDPSSDCGSDSEHIEIDQDYGSDCGSPLAAAPDSEHVKIDQDSVSESAPQSLFGDFTENEMSTRVKGMEREAIVNRFVSGMGAAGKVIHVVAVHRNLSSGLARQARFHAFSVFTDAMVRKCGGNPNIRYACFGGTKDEIAEILVHGFSARNEAVRGRVHLVPMRFAVDAAEKSGVDEDGMRHVLICRVIMGKSELMPEGFNGNGPSSSEFDSGVDSMMNPRKYIVWSASMNSHICPAYVVSFKAPGCLKKYAAPLSKVYNYHDMLPVLARFLKPEKMAVLYNLRDDYREKKISLGDLNRKLKKKVDKKVMDSTMKLLESRQGCAGPCPAPGTVNFSGVRKMLQRLIPASKLAVIDKLVDDCRQKRISQAELHQEVKLVVDDKVWAAAIKLSKPNRNVLVEAELGRLLPPSQTKIVAELIEDHNAKKISPTEFCQKYRLIVDPKTMDAAIKLAAQSIIASDDSQRRSITASDVRFNGSNSILKFSDLMPFLERSLSPQKMALLTKSLEDFKEKKISKAQMDRRVRIIVGSELFASAFKSYRSGQQKV